MAGIVPDMNGCDLSQVAYPPKSAFAFPDLMPVTGGMKVTWYAI